MRGLRLTLALLLLGAVSGCHALQILGRSDCRSDCEAPAEEKTIHIKVPPQKIVVQQEAAPPAPKPETAPGKPETAPAAPERSRPESREVEQAEDLVSTLTTINKVAGLVQGTATTSPLATVNPGGGALGLGLAWINIPIPVPRIFTVRENPTVTVPLHAGNILPMAGLQQRLVGDRQESCEMSREEMVAAVLKSMRQQAGPPPRNGGQENERLEKQLRQAEHQVERLTTILESLETKMGESKGPARLGTPPK